MKALFFAMTLLVGISAEARTRRVRVPASGLLQAARSVKPQTGPAYSASGTLQCIQENREFPPYDATVRCQVIVNRKVAEVAEPETLVTALMSVKPMTGPYYSVTARFEARSISQEVPPYGSHDEAIVTRVR